MSDSTVIMCLTSENTRCQSGALPLVGAGMAGGLDTANIAGQGRDHLPHITVCEQR